MSDGKLRAVVIGTLILAIVILGRGQLYAAPPSNTSVSGSVKDGEGKALVGAFVKFQSETTGITTSVLSQVNGTYNISLASGTYDVTGVKQGFVNDKHIGEKLSSEKEEINFTMVPGPTNMVDPGLSETQWLAALPDAPAKKQAVVLCGTCHSISGMIAKQRLDEAGWIAVVKKMRNLPGFRFGVEPLGDRDPGHGQGNTTLGDDEAKAVAKYWASVFGSDTDFKVNMAPDKFVPKQDEHALNITYVEYPIPTAYAIPHSTYAQPNGNIWITEWGSNKIGKVNKQTGKFEEYEIPTPNVRPHGITGDKYGNIYFTEAGGNKLGRVDPTTKEVSEYPLPPSHSNYAASYRTADDSASSIPHTPIIDLKGRVWFNLSAEDSIAEFDPETHKTSIYKLPLPAGKHAGGYGVARDSKGRIWFANLGGDSVGFIDTDTKNIKLFDMPAHSGPRRIEVDARDIVWTDLFNTGQLARLDPNTGAVKIYDLPTGKFAGPYGMGIDSQDHIWVYGMTDSKLFRFDSRTESFATYTLPRNGYQIRTISMDGDGWMWGSAMGIDRVIGFKVTN